MTSDKNTLTTVDTNDEKQGNLSHKDSWKTEEIKNVATINPGSINDSNFDFDNIEYLDISSTGKGFIENLTHYDIDEAPSRAKRTVKEGDTVISRVRPAREQFTLINDPDPNLVVSTGFGVLRPKESVTEKYLYYAVIAPDMITWMDNHTSGSAYPAVNISTLKHAEISIPPIEIQQKIGSVLHKIDSKIRINNDINDNIEEMTQALFKDLFVEFSNYDGKTEFDDDFEKEVPVSWQKASLDDIAEFLNGKAWQDYSSENDEENDLPVVKIKELRNGITKESDRVVSSKSPEEYILEDGDVVFSWSASLVLDLWSEGDAFLNQHLFKVTSQEYPRWFCHLWIDHHLRIFRHIADAKKTTMGHIKRTDLEEAKVLIPPQEELEEISEKMKPMFERRVKSQVENRKLEELRDTLLPKLMSGEIRVDDIKLDELTLDSEV